MVVYLLVLVSAGFVKHQNCCGIYNEVPTTEVCTIYLTKIDSLQKMVTKRFTIS